MPFPSETRVLIVGGGIAGLALARALQIRAIPYLVIERTHEAADGGLAVNLPGNAIEALRALGLGDIIAREGFAFSGREYRTGSNKLLFSVDEEAFWGRDAKPRSIKRSALTAMLADGLPEGTILRGLQVQKLHTNGDGGKVELSNGQKISAELIVGADGVKSTIRGLAFPEASGPGHALIANASWRFIGPNPGVKSWTVWAGRRGMVLLMPLSNGEVYGWAAATGKPNGGTPSEILDAAIADLPEMVKHSVRLAAGAPGGLYHSPLEEVRLNGWTRGRTVLIGDAAHATAPVWAEGIALALEDAIVLACRLDEDLTVEDALRGFESERRPRVEHVQAMTDAMSKAAKLPAFLRNLLLPIVGPKRYHQTYSPLRLPV